MTTTTVRQHRRRVSRPKTGRPVERPEIDESRPFFLEMPKRPSLAVRLACKMGFHRMQMTGETRYLSMTGRHYLQYRCRDCGRTVYRRHEVPNAE